MNHWIYPANNKYYDVFEAFKEPEVYWPINSNVSVGDEIYFYLADPYKQLVFVCEVTETGINLASIEAKINPYMKNADKNPNKPQEKPFMALKVMKTLPIEANSKLDYQSLAKNGLRGMLMGSRKLANTPPLLRYIKNNI